MAKKFPINPPHPERLCWGCDKYCPVDSLVCGNGAERTQHPAELFGADWQDWGTDSKTREIELELEIELEIETDAGKDASTKIN